MKLNAAAIGVLGVGSLAIGFGSGLGSGSFSKSSHSVAYSESPTKEMVRGLTSFRDGTTYQPNYLNNPAYDYSSSYEGREPAPYSVESSPGRGALQGAFIGLSAYSLTVFSRVPVSITAAAFAAAGLVVGASRTDSNNVLEKPLSYAATGTAAGLAVGFAASKLAPYVRGKELPLALLAGGVGAITRALSSKEFVRNPYYSSSKSTALRIYEGNNSSSDSNWTDQLRYYREGIATQVDSQNTFYDSGAVGDGFMAFLKAAPSDSLIGSFYELSPDREFLSLLKSKASLEGIGVSMGGNVSFWNLSNSLKAYGLTIGKDSKDSMARGKQGDTVDKVFASVGRFISFGGLDITDKTFPMFLGERYKSDQKGKNIILHSKVLVTKENTGFDAAFVSTGNVGNLVKNSRGNEDQINFGMLIKDPAVVAQVRTAVRAINSLTPKDTLAGIADSLPNVILGGHGAASLQRMADFVDRSQGEIYAAFAYPTAGSLATSFIKKVRTGTQVNLIAQNPYGVKGGGNAESTLALYRKLINEGVNVYMAPKESDLLVHAKAIYTEQDALTTSHNASISSDKFVVELGIAQHNTESGKAGVQAIKRVINKYGLLNVKDHPDLFKEFFYPEDYQKFKDLQKKDPFYSYIRPGVLAVIDKDIERNQGFLYLPTQLSENFSATYPGSVPQLYTDTYYTLKGKMPVGYQKHLAQNADNQLAPFGRENLLTQAAYATKGVPLLSGTLAFANLLLQGNYGSSINRLFPDLYSPGQGFAGTIAKGVGRVLDTATGFYSSEYYENLRKGKLSGGLNKYHKTQYETYQSRGFFENLLGGVAATGTALTSSLAFYFGVSHTLSIARSHFEDIGVDYVTSLLGKTSNNFTNNTLKSLFFAPELLNVFDEVDHAYSAAATLPPKGKQLSDYLEYVMHKAGVAARLTPGFLNITQADVKFFDDALLNRQNTDNLIRVLSDRLQETNNSIYSVAKAAVEKDIIGINRQTGELDLSKGLVSGFNSPSGGILSTIGSLRRIDQSNFINIIRPVLEHITIGTEVELAALNNELNYLQALVGKSPYLKFAEVLDDGSYNFADELRAEQYGYGRLEKLASSLDKIAEYVPANPLLYFKPYRDMMGITSLKVDKGSGEFETYSLRQLISPGFSGLTNFSRRMIRSIGGLKSTENIIKGVSDNFKLFEYEYKLSKAEGSLASITNKMLGRPSIRRSVANLKSISNRSSSTLLAELTEGLYGDDGALKKLAGELDGQPKSKRLITSYTNNLKKYNTLLQRTGNSQDAFNSPPPSVFRSIRNILFSVAPILILDKVLDSQLMRAPSLDLISQVFTDINFIDSDRDTKPKMDYTGAVPGYIKYPLTTAGFLLGGHLLPNFTHRQLAAGGIIEKVVDSAVGGQPLLATLNSDLAGKTGLGSLLEGLDSSKEVALAKALSKTRTSTKFGYLGAFVGGATALLAAQAFFGIASGLLNAAKSFSSKDGFKPQSDTMVAAFSLTAGIRKRFESLNKNNPITAHELGLMEVGYAAANNLLYGRSNRDRQVYTFATQIPNPIFQFTAVSKLDPQGNSLTIGAGFQFLPILGAGSIPPAPFEIRLKPLTTRASQKREQQLSQGFTSEGSTSAANWLSLLSFPGQLIAVGKDTSFSQVISFVGASSYIASGTSRVENFLRANSSAAVKRELNQIKPLYNIGKFGLETVETLARYSQVPLLVMPNALMKAATSYFNIPKESLAKLGAGSRVLAPYALAYAFAAGITGADGSFANVGSEHGSNYVALELSRFGTVATLTGIYGYGLQNAGVFARADSFSKVVGSGFIAKKQQQLSAIATEAASKGLGEAPLVRTAALRLSIASRRIFTISAVLAAAGLGLRGLTQRSFGFLDVISDSQGVPANPEEAAYQRSQGFSPARYQPKNLQEAARNYLNYLTRSIGGVLGIDKLVYRDDPNAFLSLGGSFGTSEGRAGFRLYTQAQATFVDISGSSYSLGQIMMNSDLSMQLSAALSGSKSTNYDTASETLYSDRYHKIRGATPRKTPAKTYGELSSSEAAAAAGNSSAFIAALAYRKAYADSLKHQRPSELSLDLLYEAARTGRLGSKFGFIKPGYTPLATIGSITGEIKAGTTSALDRASNFLRGLTGTGVTTADEILTQEPQEQPNRIPVISYFSDSLGYVLGGFSGKSTVAASGTIAAQQVPLILLSVGASLSFLAQTAAALAAYNQGALTQDSLRQAENKKLDFLSKAQKVGFTEIDGAYSLILEPKSKGAAKPKLLTLSSQVLADTNTVVASNAIEVTSGRLKSLSSSTQSIMKSYYMGVASLLDPSGNSVLGGIGLTNVSGEDEISDYVENLKKYVKANLLERTIAFEDSPVRKFQEILSLGDDGAEAALKTLDSLKIELNLIQGKNVSLEAKANLSRVAIASKLQDLDNRLLENATTGFVKDLELKNYTKQIGLGRSRIAGQSSAGLATSEIINKSGYIGLFKEGAAGAGRLVNRLIDLIPFYNVASALTKAAATDDRLEKSRAAGAAAYYTMQLPSIGIATFGLKALIANPLVGTAIVGAGLGLFVADQYFNKGAARKSIGKAADWFDKNIGSKITNALARGYNALTGIPIINTAFSIVGLPFRALDPVIERLWKSVENTPAGYLAMSFLLPRSVDQVYDALGAKTPGSNRAGERMELVSSAEIRTYEAQRLKYNRAKSRSIKANLYTEISPFVLGGTVSESERQLEERYFNSGGGAPRVLSPFANSSYVSSLLQMAIGRRQLEANFAGYGSFRKRRLLGYDGLGAASIAASTYYKSSLAYDGTYSGLLKHGLTTVGNIFSSVAEKISRLANRTFRTLKVLAYRKYKPVGKVIDLFRSLPNKVGSTISKIANFTPFKVTVGALKTPSALFTLAIGATYLASEHFDKKGKNRGLRLLIAANTLAVGLTSYTAYKYSSPTTKQAIRTWANNRQLPKLPPILAKSSIFALSAFAITTAASQIAVNLIGTASSYFGLNREDNDWGNKNIANFSSVQSSMVLGGVAAGATFTVSALSNRAQSVLARGSTNFYKGLAASIPGAALYAAPAWGLTKIVGLAFSDEGTSGKIEREAQSWAAGSFALLGAYRYGLARPFRKPGISVSRLHLLGGDWQRIKNIGAAIGRFVPGASQIVPIAKNIINLRVVQSAIRAVSSVAATLKNFDIGKSIKRNYPKTFRRINRTRIGAIRKFRQAKAILPSVGKFAYEFAPSVIDVGLYGYAAYDISQLNNRSTRQQYRAAYQNLTGVSVNAAAGTLLALKMRSPTAALVVAINAERTINPLIGKALGDKAYESGEDQTTRNLALGGSGLAVLVSAGYGARYALNSLQAARAASLSSLKSLGAARAVGLTDPVLKLNLLRGTTAPAAGRSLLSKSSPVISGVFSTAWTTTSVFNLNKLAVEAPKDYRIATQDIGKQAASLTTSAINSVGILGGAPGIIGTGIVTAVAEPSLESYYSSTLQKRMQIAGRTSHARVRELNENIATGSTVGLVLGALAGLGTAFGLLAAGVVTAAALPVLAVGALIGGTVGALVGLYAGVENFFRGTRASSFKWMEAESSKEKIQGRKALDEAKHKQKYANSQSSILIASSIDSHSDLGLYDFSSKTEKDSNPLADFFKFISSSVDSGFRRVKGFVRRKLNEVKTNVVDPAISGTSSLVTNLATGIANNVVGAVEGIGRFFGGKSKPLDISFAIPETQVYRGNYKSGKVSNVGAITITGGFMEPHGHSFKAATQAIFSDGKLRNLPASNRNLGIDYVSADGAVKAWLGGKVTSVGLEGGYGYRVRVTTDSTYNYQGKDYTIYQAYAHLQASGLRTDLVGKNISQGTKIGLMGGTGAGGKNSFAPHVDLRTWINVDGRQVDLSPNLLRKAKSVQSSSNAPEKKENYSSPTNSAREKGLFTTSPEVSKQSSSASLTSTSRNRLKLSTGYESLNLLAETLSINKYFDQSTAKGRAALAVALLIGGGEAFGKGVSRTDHFTIMGGAGNRMKGFAQFNTTYFSRETSTPQGYINLVGSMLTGERTLPTGRGRFNSAELALAIQQGKITTGKQLIQFVQGRISRVDWQGLYDGMRRVPGLADQLVNYLKQPKLDKESKQSFAPSVPKEAVSKTARNSLTSNTLQPEQLQAITKEYKEQTVALADLQKKGEQKLQNLTVVISKDTASRKPTEQPNEPLKSSVANAPEIATGAAISSSDRGLAVRLTTKIDDAHHVETTASPLPTHVNREVVTRESSGNSMSSGYQDLFGLAGGWMSNQFA
jgi:murein DD-endopeptidase MepM/ murein hydrolase activator NlpD